MNVGLSQTFITRLELGQYDPTLSTMVRLAKALRVSVTDLSGESMPAPWATCLSPVTRTSRRVLCAFCFLSATRKPKGSKETNQRQTRISHGEFRPGLEIYQPESVFLTSSIGISRHAPEGRSFSLKGPY